MPTSIEAVLSASASAPAVEAAPSAPAVDAAPSRLPKETLGPRVRHAPAEEYQVDASYALLPLCPDTGAALHSQSLNQL